MKTKRINSKKGSGFMIQTTTHHPFQGDSKNIEITFQESFQAGMLQDIFEFQMKEMLNEMEQVFLKYTNVYTV